MKITDEDRINFISKHSSEKIGVIKLHDLMKGCKCGSCHGVGIYEFDDDEEPLGWGGVFRKAVDDAIGRLS